MERKTSSKCDFQLSAKEDVKSLMYVAHVFLRSVVSKLKRKLKNTCRINRVISVNDFETIYHMGIFGCFRCEVVLVVWVL